MIRKYLSNPLHFPTPIRRRQSKTDPPGRQATASLCSCSSCIMWPMLCPIRDSQCLCAADDPDLRTRLLPTLRENMTAFATQANKTTFLLRGVLTSAQCAPILANFLATMSDTAEEVGGDIFSFYFFLQFKTLIWCGASRFSTSPWPQQTAGKTTTHFFSC